MNTQRLTSAYYDWTHGWHGYHVPYAFVSHNAFANSKYLQNAFAIRI
jgi:hypothetical protein